jgi:hypothetical protein
VGSATVLGHSMGSFADTLAKGGRRGRIPAPLPGVRPANPEYLSQAIQAQRE